MPDLPISIAVQTLNEEAAIAECLRSVASFDDVWVIDSGSTDRTVEIATEMGAHVVDFRWNQEYPKKKQWQLDNVDFGHDWVLFLDADERVPAEMVAELRAKRHLLEAPDVAAFDIVLLYFFADRPLRHGHRVSKRSLVHRRRVSYPVVDDLGAPGMGELEGHYQPDAHGEVHWLESELIHYDPDPVATWFTRHNKYSDWEAYLATHQAGQVNEHRSSQGQVFRKVPLKPLAFFTYSYLARGGFLDGRAGFDYAMANSFYYWQIGVKTRERRRHSRGS